MTAPVTVARTVRDHRRALLWWGLGIVAFVVLHLLVYPTVADQGAEFDRLIESYPEPLKAVFGLDEIDYASPAGYLDSELFSFMGPLILLIFAVGQGAKATAAQEESKRLDLLLANPISRVRLIAEKHGAALGMTAFLCVVMLAALWIGTEAQDMDVGVVGIAAASVGVFLLAAVYGGLALTIGALVGKKGVATGVASAAAVAAFLIHTLGRLASWLEPVRPLSPFYYYDRGNPLVDGLDLLGVGVLAAAAIVLWGLAGLAFDRRDLAG